MTKTVLDLFLTGYTLQFLNCVHLFLLFGMLWKQKTCSQLPFTFAATQEVQLGIFYFKYMPIIISQFCNVLTTIPFNNLQVQEHKRNELRFFRRTWPNTLLLEFHDHCFSQMCNSLVHSKWGEKTRLSRKLPAEVLHGKQRDERPQFCWSVWPMMPGLSESGIGWQPYKVNGNCYWRKQDPPSGWL